VIEQIIKDYLDECELGVPVVLEIPKTPAPSCYVIEKTGSSTNNHITASTIAIQSYAPSMYEAAAMNEALKPLMLNGLLTLGEIASVQLNSDYNFTDTQTKQYRYQAVFDIVHY
jgi:hypothetical protein